MHSDHLPTEAVLDVHIEEAEKALAELRELKQRLGATAVDRLDATARYELKLAAGGLKRAADAVRQIADTPPSRPELKPPPDAELYKCLLGPEFRPRSHIGVDKKPIIVELQGDTILKIGDRIIELQPLHIYIFNSLIINRYGLPTSYFAERFRQNGESREQAHARTRYVLKGFVLILGEEIVSQHHTKHRPFMFSMQVDFVDRREGDTAADDTPEVGEPSLAAEADNSDDRPSEPQSDQPPAKKTAPARPPKPRPAAKPREQLNGADVSQPHGALDSAVLQAAAEEAAVLLRAGWRDIHDIARALGIEADIVHAFVERHRAKFGGVFPRTKELRRPSWELYTTRTTEHFPPAFTAWAIASISKAKAEFEARQAKG